MADDYLEAVKKRVSEKLHEPVQKLISGQHDEHDLLPALLWVLLESEQRIEMSIRSLSSSTPERLNDLQKALADDLKRDNKRVLIDLSSQLATLSGSIQGMAMEIRAHIDQLSKSFSEADQHVHQRITAVQEGVDNLAQLLGASSTQAERHAQAMRQALEQTAQRLSVTMNQIISEIARNQAELSMSFVNSMKKLQAIVIGQGVIVILALAALVLLR